MRREFGLAVLVLLAAAWGAGSGPRGQAPTPDPAASEAAAAVRASVEVELRLLEEDVARHEELARRRASAASRLTELYRSLEEAVREHGAETPARVDLLLDLVQQGEAERAQTAGAERLLVERIRDRLRRIELLEEQIAGLEQRQEAEQAGVLSGSWSLVLMPAGQHGTASLRQSGTLVSGTYELEGGFSGSLQGTLVNRKVFLVRIDSKLGKSMELEGYLSGDGKRIRGSWLSYELAGSEAGTGQWSAERRSANP
jgi:hypothetical protein